MNLARPARSRLGVRMIRACLSTLAAALLCVATPAAAQAPVKQIKLTETHIQGFIAAQKPMSAVTEKMQGSTPDKLDSKIQAELEDISRKSGFKDFAEYDDVVANISMVMARIDPETKTFTDPQTALAQEITEVTADKAIPANERKQMLDELNEALKAARPIQFPGNVELVRKYYDRIEEMLQ